jgi:hypothetical protein
MPHILRGYFLSGYPFFPLTLGSFFDFEWKLASDKPQIHSKIISCWAKGVIFQDCGNNFDFNWINGWFKNTPVEILFYLLVSIFLFICSLFKFNSNTNSNVRKLSHLSLIPLISLLIWFVTAPDPRFSISIIMLFFACSTSIFFSTYNVKINFVTNINKLIVLIFLSLLISTLRFSTITMKNFIYILNNGRFDLPVHEYSSLRSNGDLIVNIPNNSKCYDIELPCAHRFNESLYLINNENRYPKIYFKIQ